MLSAMVNQAYVFAENKISLVMRHLIKEGKKKKKEVQCRSSKRLL